MTATKTVLIIDDDADYRSLMRDVLQTGGWQVMEAGDGDKGVEIAREQRPQAVICDLLMPRGNGFHVCRAIREDAMLRHIKILVTSGRDYDSDRLAAREAGADEYLTKPAPPSKILEALGRLTAATHFPERPSQVVDNGAPQTPARVKFWGVRGSIATPGPATMRYGGNTSCIEVRAGGEIIILDAGTGLRSLGKELMAEYGKKRLDLTLLLTHSHWDHIQGLPFFAPIYEPQCHLRILGFEGARTSLVNVLTSQMESPYFPVPFSELPGNIEIVELKDMNFRVGSVRVQAWFANHPGICVGYRIFTDEGSVAFFPDNEPYTRSHNLTLPTPATDTALRTYAQTQEQKIVDFLKDTDVLIFDSQYDSQEYQRHIGWGHGCVDHTVSLALRAGVKQLHLFHHDPDHDDAKVDDMLAHARKLVASQNSPLRVEASREGEVVELAKVGRGAV